MLFAALQRKYGAERAFISTSLKLKIINKESKNQSKKQNTKCKQQNTNNLRAGTNYAIGTWPGGAFFMEK